MTTLAQRFAVSLAALSLFTPVDAEDLPGNEQLLTVVPDGWHETYAGREENLSTTEYVPGDQDADDWKEMFTVQVLVGEGDGDPTTMLARVATHLDQHCLHFDARPVALGGVDEYPTLAAMFMCGKLPDEKGGEFTLIRGIAGKENFYLLQKTWRTAVYDAADAPPIPLEERRFWIGFLAYLRVCDLAAGTCEQTPTPDEN